MNTTPLFVTVQVQLKYQNWTMARLAAECGWARTAVYTRLQAARPSYDTIRKVAGALGLTVEELEDATETTKGRIAAAR
jgi:DNA-binding phage protein